ncbi:hypothetical protein GCM10028833_41860 [Glycomyces tarimensis]
MKSIVRESGASTIRIVGLNGMDPFDVASRFEQTGAEFEVLESFGIVAFSVAGSANVRRFREVLDQGSREGIWDYDEGCLAEAWAAA